MQQIKGKACKNSTVLCIFLFYYYIVLTTEINIYNFVKITQISEVMQLRPQTIRR